MFEKMLPIGSVVLLNNAIKKTMIIGYMQMTAEDKNRLHDYVGVMYPGGSLGASTQFLFDQEDIQDIIFTGYKNSEYEKLIDSLEEQAEKDPEFARAVSTKVIMTEE